MNLFAIIISAALAAACCWRAIVMLKNAYEIHKVMRTDASNEVKIAFWRQLGTGLFYVFGAVFITMELIEMLKGLSIPR